MKEALKVQTVLEDGIIQQQFGAHDFSVIGTEVNTYPEEPKEGIALGEEFSYEIEVKEGIMTLKNGINIKTKMFTKICIFCCNKRANYYRWKLFNLNPILFNFTKASCLTTHIKGCFFKLGCYNQTNGKSPEVNKNWCSGAETHGGNLQKQYADGNYAEVWFKSAHIEINDQAISNEGYFSVNDDLT